MIIESQLLLIAGSKAWTYLEGHLELLGVFLSGVSQWKNADTVRSPVYRAPSFVPARVGILHFTASHHVCDDMEIATQVGVSEIRKDGAIAM